MGRPAGKIGHAELKIGDSMVMLFDEMPAAEIVLRNRSADRL